MRVADEIRRKLNEALAPAQLDVIDESARRRTATGPVDFMPINDSNWRDGLGADRFEFNTLRDKRPGDKNRPFFNFLLRLRSLVDVRIGKHRSGKQCRDNSCSS